MVKVHIKQMNKTGENQMNEIRLQLRYGQLFFIGLPRAGPLTPFSIKKDLP